MIRPSHAAPAVIAFASALALLAACISPDGRTAERVPDRASFADVAALLVHRCGTLDCHGQATRNLRLYGSEGLRLSSADRPLAPLCSTSAEIDEDFASVVGLEPEVMTAIVAEHGAQPERLTMVRKARGLESHKGGTLMPAGDDEDTCITSWLAGQTRTDACARALPASTCLTR
jgi:hypothetical protein